MLGDKKIIGLCMTRIEEGKRSLLVNRIYHALPGEEYRLVCFCGSAQEEQGGYTPGKQTVFDRMDYHILDGMILCETHFQDKRLLETICEHGENRKIPVVVIEGTRDGNLKDRDREKLQEAFGPLDFSWEVKESIPTGEEILQLMHRRDQQAELLSGCVREMLDNEEAKHLYRPLAKAALPGSWVCLNSRFMKLVFGNQEDQYTTVAIPAHNDGAVEYIDDHQMLPDGEQWVLEDNFYLITLLQGKNICCGYLAIKTGDAREVGAELSMFIRFVDLAFHSIINQYVFRNMMKDMRSSAYMDPLTGLYNLKGATKWFEEFSAKDENHVKCLAVTVYALPKYAYLYETFGIREVEEIVSFLAEKLKQIYTGNHLLAKISNSEFIVIHYFEAADQVSKALEGCSDAFFEMVEEYNRNSEKEYFLEVNSGCTVAYPGWTGTLESFVKYATSEMFLNRLKGGITETVKEDRQPQEFYSVFNLLIENNLFTYHYQPIVDAKTGEIIAYEALMRTCGGINMTPMEILDTARAYKRLDEVEYATLFNVMQRYMDEKEKFYGRRLFINTIPRHFLREEARAQLVERFRSVIDHFVFEVTEHDSVSDEELEILKGMCGSDGTSNIAIDDYGAGHSNIVNLLRYEPQIIKIDHYLINEIDKDTNKQMFVKNTIEFAELNHIKVLAEGVETYEELQMVIDFGVDYIQGFYTGKASPEPLRELPAAIRNEIIGENLKLTKYNIGSQKFYNAKAGETINLVALALQRYVGINIVAGRVRILGKKDSPISMVIRIADNADVQLEMLDINLSGTDEPVVQLGKGSNVELILRGYNAIYKDGIRVPKNSKLRITGAGSLILNINRHNGVGIGGDYNSPYGEIILDMEGRLRITSTGDRFAGIGGGRSDSAILLRRGNIEISGSGMASLGVGSSQGEANIRLGEKARLVVKESANAAVGIGSMKGMVRISLAGFCSVVADGEKSVAIGSLGGAGGVVSMEAGTVKAVAHCDSGAVIGTHSGNISLVCNDCRVDVYGEGASVAGIGSFAGQCTTEINGGIVAVKLLSAGAMPFGSFEDRVIITGGNVLDLGDNLELSAYNAYGQKLSRRSIEEDTFEQVIRAEDGEYLYTAKRSREYDRLEVYLP